jgi:hypothetical protein
MGSKDDEAEEYARQARERAKLSPIERLHGGPTRKTASGLPDMRSMRRTGNVVPLAMRVHPMIKATAMAIMARDRHASMVALYIEMLELYQKTHGPIDRSQLPTEEELVQLIEMERLARDE